MSETPSNEKTRLPMEQKATLPSWVAGVLLLVGGASGGVVVKIALPGDGGGNGDLAELKRLVTQISRTDPRPDPWTGAQARDQAAAEAAALASVAEHMAREIERIEIDCSTMERRLEKIQETVSKHNEVAGIWKGRINSNSLRLDRLERSDKLFHRNERYPENEDTTYPVIKKR